MNYSHDPFIEEFNKLSQLTDRLGLLLTVADASNFLYLSENWTKCLGWSRQELLSQPYADFILKEDVERSREAWQEAARGQISHFRNRYRHKDGSIRVLEWYGKLENERALSIAQDVTSWVEVEERWQLAHQLVQDTCDAMITLDRVGSILNWNQGASQMLEWREDEVRGRSLDQLVLTEAHSQNLCSLLNDRTQTPQTRRQRMVWRKKSGIFLDVGVSISPVRGKHPNVQFFGVVARDLTDEVKLATLHDQTERTANIGGWEVELGTQAILWTDQTYRIHEVPMGESMMLEDAIRFYSDWSQPIMRQAISQALSTGEPFDLELQLNTRRGKRLWVRVQGRATLIGGQPHRLFGTFQDISERKRDESALQQARSHLASAEKLASLGALSAEIAHEINNPLAILQGKISILKRLLSTQRFDAQQFQSLLERMEITVERMGSIVSSLRSYSLQEDHVDQFKLVDLGGVIKNVVEMNYLRTVELGVRVTCQFPPESMEIEGEEIGLFQVFSNLLINALDAVANQNERWILIEGKKDVDAVELRFVDSGKGIPQTTQARIFDTFFSTKGHHGTGLGLSISRRLVEHHGGKIKLDSQSPNTTFVVTLPQRQAVRDRQTRPFQAPFGSQPTHILLIEDEIELVESLKFFLEEEGLAVTVSTTAAGALEHMNLADFRVILCDYRLPDASGEELLRRAPERSMAAKWIFITGYSDVLRDHEPNVQVVAVLRKPIDYGEVVRHVRQALG